MAIDLEEAMVRHRAGDLEGAAKIYAEALRETPDRPDALHLLGLVQLQCGRPEHALGLIGRAVAVAPNEPTYHASLAEVYWSLRQLDRALSCYRSALRLKPDDPEVLCNLGATLVDQGNVDAAIPCFHDALRLRPDFVVAHNNLGNALQLKGDTNAALVHYQKAVRLDPSIAGAHNNLGKIVLERGNPKAALVHCTEAVRLLPNSAEFRINLGNVLLALDRTEEAADVFRAAIQLKPDLASAHASLGGVYEQLGDVEQALAAYREALRFDPRHTGALARLATILRGDLSQADRTCIESLLTDSSLSPERRWSLEFSWANMLEAQGEFHRAAEFASRANACQRAEFERRGRGYDPSAHKRFVDQVIDSFTPEFFERVSAFGVETERPVFVVGLPRSGTSLIEQILASHPRVFGAGELRLFQETFEALPEAVGHSESLSGCLKRVDRAVIQRLASRHLEGLAALNSSADRVVDKMPENTLYLGLIAALFPKAKLIHCRRDLRDVALSCWMTNFGQVRWASDLDHIAARITEYRRVMDHWGNALPIPMLEVKYEEIVCDLEGVSRTLLAWCGLEWDPACVSFYQTRRPVRTASAAQVRQPVYKSSVGRWKHFQEELGPLFSKLELD